MSTSDFKLPTKTRRSIEEGWDCALTEEAITYLEEVADDLISTARSIALEAEKQASPEQSARASKRIRTARKRHKDIGKTASDLLELLEKDEQDYQLLRLRDQTFYHPSTRAIYKNTVDDTLSIVSDLFILTGFASVNWMNERAASKERKSKSSTGAPPGRDPWRSFITELMLIYYWQTELTPTISRNVYREERYDSPFLRGFYALYDALPDDVRREASKSVLGSRAYELLKSWKRDLSD